MPIGWLSCQGNAGQGSRSSANLTRTVFHTERVLFPRKRAIDTGYYEIIDDVTVDDPQYLYHYTSAGGLAGILSSRSVWATDTAFLNDASEILYAGEKLESMLIDYRKQIELENPPHGSAKDRRRVIAGIAASALTKFMRPEEDPFPDESTKEGATYVACFSTEPDQLSQWRGYGGLAYSIGFNRAGVDAMTVHGETDPDRVKAGPAVAVGYGQDAITHLMTGIINDLVALPSSGAASTGFLEAVHHCMPRVARIKHGAFKEEKEWRLVVSRYGVDPAKEISFRYGVRLIPFIKLTFEMSAVSHIYIGPGNDFDSVRALRGLLRSSGYDVSAVSIERSEAPYRDAKTI
jgi:hypothetical protein